MARRVFAFAEFTFDSDTGTLTRKNRGSRLPEKTARLLELLLERANTLVSREELRSALWPDAEFLDYDQGINVAVNRLRNALREDSRNPQFLKTIPKRGYSFCAEVRLLPKQGFSVAGVAEPTPSPAIEEPAANTVATATVPVLPEFPDLPVAPTGTPADSVADPVAPTAARSPALRRPWLWGLVVLAAAGVVVWAVWRSGRLPAATGSLLRIGIAPISVQGIAQTSGRDGGEVGEGFRLRLIDAISRLPGVQVPSAAAFATSNPDEMPHIARDLKLDDLLLGSIAARAPSTT